MTRTRGADAPASPFPLAVQYYRQPTPLPEEWDGDLAHIRELGINTIQLRPQWRWHERTEGTYRWDDLDRLFDLAGKHGLRVVLKFMLETAPDWLYRDYPATRYWPDGRPMTPGAEGAFYPGGWLPCFDASEVAERAARFVRVAAERYRERPELAWWHAWNEPRSRPGGECACPASSASYREYLRERFGTIDALNGFLGKCWASFEDIRPPAGVTEYAERFLWRHWAAARVAARVRLVAETIRSVDPSRPVMAHVGCCSLVQNALEDTSDDMQVAPTVDLYGTSLAVGLNDRYTPDSLALNCDWMRAVNRGRPWWVNEAYSDPSAGFRRELGPAEIRQMFLTPLAHGAQGVMFWQYRAERLGIESSDCGMVTVAGEDTLRSLEVGRIGRFLGSHGRLFVGAKVPRAKIALVYDFRSDLLSAIEGATLGTGERRPGHPYAISVRYAYKLALQGAYALFWDAGYEVEWVDARDPGLVPGGFRMAYLPLPFFVGGKLAGELLAFIRSGGLLVAEAGLGLRAENAWVEGKAPGTALADLGYRLDRHFRLRRRRIDVELDLLGGAAFPSLEYFDRLRPSPGGRARPVGRWRSPGTEFLPDGGPAALERRIGKGRALVLAFSPGLTRSAGSPGRCTELADGLAAAAGVARSVSLSGEGAEHVAARVLLGSDGRRILFLRNDGPGEARVGVSVADGWSPGEDLWGGSSRKGGRVVLPRGEFAVLAEEPAP